jgi:excisionase family DNA binding protein
MNEAGKYLTTVEVAKMLQIKPQTLEKARSTGLGPTIPYIKVGRGVRYAMSDVLAWLNSRRHQ